MNILLIEPKLRNQHPNLGLLKIGEYHRRLGDQVLYLRGSTVGCNFYPAIVYISCIFSYTLNSLEFLVEEVKSKYPRAEIQIGGVFPTLMPEKVLETTGIQPHIGLLEHVESLPPDYSLVPIDDRFANTSFVFTSRGCSNNCSFCCVPKLEPKQYQVEGWKEHIRLDHKLIVIYDNNFSAQPEAHRNDVFSFLRQKKLLSIFDNGFDAALFDESHAEALASIQSSRIRFALDHISELSNVERAIHNCIRVGIMPTKIQVYVMYGYRDTLEDTVERCSSLVDMGVTPYPQSYKPIFQLDRNHQYVENGWTLSTLRMIRYFYTMPSLYKSMSFWDWFKKGCPTLKGSKVIFNEERMHIKKL